MKILHCADFHITCLKKLLGEDNAYDRAQKALYALSHVVWEENPDVIVILGDIFDDDYPNSDEIFLFNQFLLPILEEGINVLIIPGNHDSESKGGKTAIDFLFPFDESLENFHVALREPKIVCIKGVAFIMWPWGILPKREDRLLFTQSGGRYPKKRIGLLHTPLKDSKISEDGRRLRKGFSITTAKETLKVFNLSYLLLGDIHEYQVFYDRIIYSGSLYQTKFDASPTKGVVLIDTDWDTQRFIPIDGVPLLKTISSPNKINDSDFFKFNTDSKEETLKLLSKDFPPNVVKIEHSLKRQKQEDIVESNSKVGLKIHLVPILTRILHKQGVKDIRGAMKYLISMADSKEDFILP